MPKILVYDAETYGFTSNTAIIGFYDGKDKYIQNSVIDFLTELWNYSKNDHIRVFGHNSGKFDAKILLEYIYKSDFKKYLKIETVISGSLYLVLQKGKTKVEIWDSYRLMPRALEGIGADFGYRKMSYDDYEEHKDLEKLKSYFENDLVITYNILMEFYNIIEKETTKLGLDVNIRNKKTIAGLSFSILLEMKKDGVKIKKLTQNYMTKYDEDFIRKAYKGGRTEVFKRKAQDCFYYDVNSLYPFVMHNFQFPLGRYTKITHLETIQYMLKNGFLGVVKARIISSKCENDNDIYYLGTKVDNKLVFGNLENVVGYWTALEINRALDIGYKIELLEGIFYQEKGYIFDEFVDVFYNIKEEATRNKQNSLRYLAKLILNSCYGKFAQRRKMSKIITQDEAIKKKIPFSELEYITQNLYKRDINSYANRNINPIYAVYITAHARDVLYQYMKKVNFDVVYCDTDSLITHTFLETGEHLGQMKQEDYIKEGYFVIPKVYSYINDKEEIVLKAKGIRIKKKVKNDWVQLVSYNDIKEIVENNLTFDIPQERILGFFEQSKRLLYKHKDTYIINVQMKKELKSNELKRKIVNKYDTKALVVKDVQDKDIADNRDK